MMKEAYKDFKELIESGKYKSFKNQEEQQLMLNDYICLTTIRSAATCSKTEISVYQKVAVTFSKLLSDGQKTPNDAKRGNKSFDYNQPVSTSNESQVLQSIIRSGNTSTTLDAKQPSLRAVKGLNKEKELIPSENIGTYRENIFSNEDYFLYRAVANFYCRKYQIAINDFQESARQKKESKTLTIGREQEEPSETNSVDTDLSDVGLCSLNINEYAFNIILCYILVNFICLSNRWRIWKRL